ncbi:MAG: hypothetical protein ACE3K5_13015 [Candidatus Pristimantibacillus sp.]
MKYQTGQDIVAAAKNANSYYEKMIEHMDGISGIMELNDLGILNEDSPTSGAGSPEYIGSTYEDIEGVLNFIEEYHKFNGTPYDKNKLYNYLSYTENELQLIIEQRKPSTESQKKYVTSLKEKLVKQQEIIKRFNLDAEGSRAASIQLASGIGWLDIAEQLEQELNNSME